MDDSHGTCGDIDDPKVQFPMDFHAPATCGTVLLVDVSVPPNYPKGLSQMMQDRFFAFTNFPAPPISLLFKATI